MSIDALRELAELFAGSPVSLFLLLVIVTGWRGWWVFGWQHKAMERRALRAERLVERQREQFRRALDLVESRGDGNR